MPRTGCIERIAAAKPTSITPLAMRVTDTAGQHHDALALNEVSLFRTTYQAVKVEILVDGQTQMDELICDGILLSTPAGSTAYNLSAHGPILPIDAPLLALTPISPFRPRRWRGAILSNNAVVTFRTHETEKRPVSAVADNVEFTNVAEVVVRENREHPGDAAVRSRHRARRARAERAVPLLGRRQGQALFVGVDHRHRAVAAPASPAKADITPRAARRARTTFCSLR